MDKQANEEGRWLTRPCENAHDVARILKEMHDSLKARPGGGAEAAMYVGYSCFEKMELKRAAHGKQLARNILAGMEGYDGEPLDDGLVSVYDAKGDLDEVSVTHCRDGRLYGWSHKLMRRVVVDPGDIGFGDALKLAADIGNWAERGDNPQNEEQNSDKK